MADLTPAEELRAAAARLREHAKSASTWPWTSAPSWAGKNAVLNATGHPVAVCGEEIPGSDHPASADAAWIALAHPGLAEPLAVWLEEAARQAACHQQTPGYVGLPDYRLRHNCQEEECYGLQALDKALAVARVILGGGRG